MYIKPEMELIEFTNAIFTEGLTDGGSKDMDEEDGGDIWSPWG